MFMKTVLFLLSMMFGAASIGAESSKEHYLFVYFTGNTTTQQQICYALSSNGVDFIPLNGGAPVIASDTIAIMKGVRDPHILRGHDGWFYMVATDMDWTKGKWSNRGIVMMRSRNLLDWEHHTVDFHERFVGEAAAKVNAVWAPQTIWDPSVQKYMIYFSLHSEKKGPYPQDAVYYTYANSDFSDVEDVPRLLSVIRIRLLIRILWWMSLACIISFLIHGEDRMVCYVVNTRLLTFMTKVNGHWLKEGCSPTTLHRKVLVSTLWLEEVGCWCMIALKVDSANFAGVTT